MLLLLALLGCGGADGEGIGSSDRHPTVDLHASGASVVVGDLSPFSTTGSPVR